MNYKTKLSGIKLFAFDYDGVFTNGTVYLMPDGSMARTASARDGFAVQWAVKQGLELSRTAGGELERSCWMVVHEHHHGVKPSEYDIREIDEDLYLAVLEAAREAQ